MAWCRLIDMARSLSIACRYLPYAERHPSTSLCRRVLLSRLPVSTLSSCMPPNCGQVCINKKIDSTYTSGFIFSPGGCCRAGRSRTTRAYFSPPRLEHSGGGNRPVRPGRRASRPRLTNVGGGCPDLATQAARSGSANPGPVAIGPFPRSVSDKSPGISQLHTLPRVRAAMTAGDDVSTGGAATTRSRDRSKIRTSAFHR